MPTSVPGSSASHRAAALRSRGFTLIELLIVIALIAISAGVMSLALRDSNATKLEEEAARLSALLEMARSEARVSGAAVRWVPYSAGQGAETGVNFRFVGLSPLNKEPLPTRWLDGGTSAEVVGAPLVVLGPEAILPPQRIVLRLADQRLELASDGLAPFAVATGASAPGVP